MTWQRMISCTCPVSFDAAVTFERLAFLEKKKTGKQSVSNLGQFVISSFCVCFEKGHWIPSHILHDGRRPMTRRHDSQREQGISRKQSE